MVKAVDTMDFDSEHFIVMVYKDCKMYGPYNNSKDGRLRCVVVFQDGKKKTVSYPKYLMEVHLGRYLTSDETVDHIDGNFLNNDLSNLQVIDRRLHAQMDVRRNVDVVVSCRYCGKSFTIAGSTLSDRNRSDRKQSGYFCSRRCSGLYGKAIQEGRMERTIVDRIVADTYTAKSAYMESV